MHDHQVSLAGGAAEKKPTVADDETLLRAIDGHDAELRAINKKVNIQGNSTHVAVGLI